MPEYRVEFPDGQAWKIEVSGKRGEDALREAWKRAVTARAVDGLEATPFDDCTVLRMTAQVRAELKGMVYMSSATMLATCLKIGEEYQSQGMALTVRGMYYQLVSRGHLPSGQKEYNRVKSLLANERLRGGFPLDLLSDSSRTLHQGQSTRYDLDVDRAIEQAEAWIPQLDKFFLQGARWYRQPNLPIVLFEKEALSNVFGPTCTRLGVPWMAVKGYPSLSTIIELHDLMARSCDPSLLDYDLSSLGFSQLRYLDPLARKPTQDHEQSEYDMLLDGHEEATRALEELKADDYWVDRNEEADGPKEHSGGTHYRYRYGDLTADQWHQGTCQRVRLLYFGDHDPDGMEIPDDLERRLRIVQVRRDQIIPFTIERLGLNRTQIERYNPPPFFAKQTSSRYDAYTAAHPWADNRAWELDALDPVVLRRLVERAVADYFDEGIFASVQEAVQGARDRFNHQMQQEVLPALISDAEDPDV